MTQRVGIALLYLSLLPKAWERYAEPVLVSYLTMCGAVVNLVFIFLLIWR